MYVCTNGFSGWFKLFVWNCSNKIVYRTEFYREDMYRKKFNLSLYRASTSFIAFTGSGTLLNHFCKGVFKCSITGSVNGAPIYSPSKKLHRWRKTIKHSLLLMNKAQFHNNVQSSGRNAPASKQPKISPARYRRALCSTHWEADHHDTFL